MSVQRVRIGMVGAGGNVRARHFPGFRALEGVELVSVCNRSRESSERAAAEYGVPTMYDNWLDLVEADDIDAVFIGTWPNMHCSITLAALENDKHVLTEARMAMNAPEAHAMLEASRAVPHLVTQIVPAPMTLPIDAMLMALLDDGYLGEPLAVDMRVASRGFVDTDGPMRWRHDRLLSGYNTMNMGIWSEILIRWLGPASKVTAMTKTVVQQRKDDEGRLRAVTVPDHVDILTELACGVQAHLRISAVTGLGPANEVWFYGSEGTIRLNIDTLSLEIGKRGDEALTPVVIPPERQVRSVAPGLPPGWRVEEEFVNAVRGVEPVRLTTFEAGVQYMEFSEAVTRSAQTGEAISLPL